jgi:hypothetical protein
MVTWEVISLIVVLQRLMKRLLAAVIHWRRCRCTGCSSDVALSSQMYRPVVVADVVLYDPFYSICALAVALVDVNLCAEVCVRRQWRSSLSRRPTPTTDTKGKTGEFGIICFLKYQ